MATSQRSQLISLYEALIKSWNNRDAKGMAGLYASGGGQIGFDGSQVSGARRHRKTSRAHIPRPSHRQVRFHHPGREIARRGRGPGCAPSPAWFPATARTINPSLNTVQTMLARKQRSLWKVELFQNTPARLDGRPEEVAAMTQELQAVVKAQL